MSELKHPFPIYCDGTIEWFRLSEIPSEEKKSFRDWFIDNFLILDAELPEKKGVKDAFYLKYYVYWKQGIRVKLLEDQVGSTTVH